MTFKDYMLQRTATYDAKGDFVRLALADANFPCGAEWEEMQTYIMQRHGNHVLADAGQDVWKDFERLLRAQIRRAYRVANNLTRSNRSKTKVWRKT